MLCHTIWGQTPRKASFFDAVTIRDWGFSFWEDGMATEFEILLAVIRSELLEDYNDEGFCGRLWSKLTWKKIK